MTSKDGEFRSYGSVANEDLLEFMGSISGRVLDVGCGEGVWIRQLRKMGAEWVVGVEPDESAAAVAEERYDQLVRGSFSNESGGVLEDSEFDLVIFADVLEHMVNPWEALRYARALAKKSGHIVVSVPNLREARLLADLTCFGNFDYVDGGGIMDRGHLRWFTASTLSSDLMDAGWQVARVGGSCSVKREYLSRMTGGLLDEFLWYQIFVWGSAREA